MIMFPERKSKVKTAKHSDFKGGRGRMYAVELEMENGDVFSHYSSNPQDLKNIKEKTTLQYVLTKTDDQKTKIKSLKIFKKMKKKPLISYFDSIKLSDILFIDIETVRVQDSIKPNTDLYNSWAYKRRKEDETTQKALKQSFKEKAPLFSEFGKIVCISIGMVRSDDVYIQSYHGNDEHKLLTDFITVLEKFRTSNSNLKICGHSIIGFDIPYIMRRLLVNNIRVPDFLDVMDKKPWDITDKFIDTTNLWKGTSFYGASLINLAVSLGIPSPKDDIDGSQVSTEWYGGNQEKVVKYCEKDVFSTINILEHLYNREKSSTFVSKTFTDE